ncbi:MAG: ice-binding family protein [Polaromonas sp.]
MNKFYKPLTWVMAALLAGCGGGGDTNISDSGRNTGVQADAPSRSVASANPTVASTSPGSNATNVPTSTNSSNNIVTGTAVSATFSLPMDPATLISSQAGKLLTFTLKDSTGNNVSGTVAMNAVNTVATFTPTLSALLPNTSYTATVSTAAKSAGGSALAAPVTWSFLTRAIAFTAQAPVNLGSAGNFALLSKTGITDVYASAIVGNVGTSPITGAALLLTCGEVTGNVYVVDAAGPLPCAINDATTLTAAVGDMETAYLDAQGRTSPNATELGAGEIGGLTLAPGLYKWGTDVLISTDVTLSGGPNDVWIFQVAGKLIQANAKRVTLAGGAQAKNIFWQVADDVSIGTTAHFEGVALGKTLVSVKTGASANSRLFAQTAVTLEMNAITQPAQ